MGLNREREHKPAGLRTYMLVTFGTTLLALLPVQLGMALDSTDAFSRIIQGIVTGISFLGGGTILRDRDRVRGLTSAAAIWVAAALGLLIGCGLWQLGLGSVLICWIILKVVKQIEPL
ncbi:MgtC/SapB family protein [Laspinema olomoucense]|uniref:MgtC/SapB family protein n=1 Tax=Laspinema olomoucense D3b TaxID=2953688 RepID=A0ABT2N776_9CYAN|nr:MULTISPECIES: MgtC/SapB family protein [unclassified Laspinema]MCT7975407.1 MgtC/SapB family protein [Laspinema sp. D3d]MCT7978536.1 MgtC/SapB family protein [Laspinema sp. D3b]MCT7991371.1 MgtC/SapB family protein [Laspinema sp. D3a]